MSARELHHEAAQAAVGRWLVPDVAVHRVDQTAHDRQAETGAGRVPLAAGARLRELLEQPWPELLRHSFTAVTYGDPDRRFVLDHVNGHRLRAVLHRVVEQVDQQPPQML